MKSRLAATAFIALTAFVALAQNEPVKAVLHIEGMTCGSCATAVKIVLRKTPGVKEAKVSYEGKRADVSYDPSATSPQKIANAIADALAYKVTPLDGRVAAATTKSAGCDLPSPPTGKPIALPSYSEQELRDAFNSASDRVRMIALLSPTCGACQHGQRVVQSVFSKFSDPRLHGFVVWLPMLSGDNVSAAQIQAASFTDSRILQRWDERRASGVEFSKVLKLNGDAWDVYLLYAPGVKWTGAEPPAPRFWMHQLRAERGADQNLCLNPAAMTAKVQDLLKAKKG